VLVDEEGYAIDGGFFGEDFLVVIVVIDDGLLFEDVVLIEFSIFAWLFVLGVGLGVDLGIGLGLKFGGGSRFRSGNRVNRCLGLGLGIVLGFLDLDLGFNWSLLDDFGLLGVLARLLLLDLNLGFNGSLLDNFSLFGVLARLLDFGFIARGVDEILNDVLVGNIALNGDGLLGPRLANLGLLDRLVSGSDKLLHDLGVGRGL